MNLKKYTGVTLLYLCRYKMKSIAVKKSYIINAKTLKVLKGEINRTIKKSSGDFREVGCKYLGVNDVFEINGPLRQGAILGRVILWSYKTILAAKRLLKHKSEFWIYADKNKSSKEYIAEIVFILGSPIKYSDRRVIICNVFIEASNKRDILKKAMKVGMFHELRDKLFSALLQQEPLLENTLTFVGIANIKFVYDKVAIGKCFEALCKVERSLNSAKKLVFPIEKCLYKF